jgi:hypothetical protein
MNMLPHPHWYAITFALGTGRLFVLELHAGQHVLPPRDHVGVIDDPGDERDDAGRAREDPRPVAGGEVGGEHDAGQVVGVRGSETTLALFDDEG